MRKFMQLFFSFVWCLGFFISPVVFGEEINLRYMFKESDTGFYSFESSYRSQVTDPYKIHNLEEKLSGTQEYKVLREMDDGLVEIWQQTFIDKKIHNAKEDHLEDYQRGILAYEYVSHPRQGKIKIKENPDYSPRDAMEMNLSFPDNPVKKGDKWPVTYLYHLSMPNQMPLEVPGFYLLKDIKGDTADIEGRFRVKIESSADFQFKGEVSFLHRFRFNWRQGYIEGASLSKTFRLYSTSRLAKKYYEDTKGAAEALRLGYEIDFNSNIKRIR